MSGVLTGGAAGNSLAELEFSDFFSVRRPKHVFAGISSGAQSAAKGTGAGAAALVGAPVVGAYTVRPGSLGCPAVAGLSQAVPV